jgi:hypothetical protein
VQFAGDGVALVHQGQATAALIALQIAQGQGEQPGKRIHQAAVAALEEEFPGASTISTP